MSSDIGVGDTVVCIAEGWPSPYGETVPKKDSIYTVRGVILGVTKAGLRLKEIRNPPRDYHDQQTECAFDSVAFRKCLPTNIEIFTKIDADIFKRVDA